MVLISHFRIDEILFGILDEQTFFVSQGNIMIMQSFMPLYFLCSKINRDDILLKQKTCNVRQQDRRTITLLITCCDFFVCPESKINKNDYLNISFLQSFK